MGELLEPVVEGQNSQRVALCIEYNGSSFNGWQSQKSQDVATVQDTLENALAKVADHPVKLTCAGRTDSGVHGIGQIVHFDFNNPRPEEAWVRGGNSHLPDTISIRWAREVSQDFHARFSATARRYRYIIFNNAVRPALLSRLVTPHYIPLDDKAMHEAGQQLLGENDFTSFRGATCQSSTPMRNVQALSITRQGDFVIMDIQANAFLLHMVRNIAGTLMEIGEGLKPLSWAGDVLEMKDRTQAGVTALPDGLYLTGVIYPDEFDLPSSPEGPYILAAED